MLYVFQSDTLLDREILGHIFTMILSKILLKILEKELDQREIDRQKELANVIVTEEEIDLGLKTSEYLNQIGENGEFSKEIREKFRNELLEEKKRPDYYVSDEEVDAVLKYNHEAQMNADGTFPKELREKVKKDLYETNKNNSGLERCCTSLEKISTNPELLISIVEDITEFIEQYSSNSNEIRKQQLQEIALAIGKILFPDEENTQKIIESIFNFINGDFDRLSPELFNLFNIDKKTFKIIKTLLEEFKSILQAPQVYVNKKITYLTSSLTGQNVSSLDLIKDKLKMQKDMDSKDLFNVFDSDKSGKISLDEFKLLTKRLNMTLSDHRIREIFTSVKGDEINYNQELNEKEFEKALNYLQEKSIMLTLEYLGITKEILFGILIWLVTLLLILFAFIFVGIAAFAIGGTFGSIINSLFPIGNILKIFA